MLQDVRAKLLEPLQYPRLALHRDNYLLSLSLTQRFKGEPLDLDTVFLFLQAGAQSTTK